MVCTVQQISDLAHFDNISRIDSSDQAIERIKEQCIYRCTWCDAHLMVAHDLSNWSSRASFHEMSNTHQLNRHRFESNDATDENSAEDSPFDEDRSENPSDVEDSSIRSNASPSNEHIEDFQTPVRFKRSRDRKLLSQATKPDSIADGVDESTLADEDPSNWVDIPENWKSLRPRSSSRSIVWSAVPNESKQEILQRLFRTAARFTWIDSSDRAHLVAMEIGVYWCRRCGSCHNLSGSPDRLSRVLHYHKSTYHKSSTRSIQTNESQQTDPQDRVRRKCLERLERLHQQYRWIDTSQEARDSLRLHGTYRCAWCPATLLIPWNGKMGPWSSRARQHEHTPGHRQAQLTHKLAQVPPPIDIIEISDDEPVQPPLISEPKFIPMEDESRDSENTSVDHDRSASSPQVSAAAAPTQAAQSASVCSAGQQLSDQPQPTPPSAPIRPRLPRLPRLPRFRETSPASSRCPIVHIASTASYSSISTATFR